MRNNGRRLTLYWWKNNLFIIMPIYREVSRDWVNSHFSDEGFVADVGDVTTLCRRCHARSTLRYLPVWCEFVCRLLECFHFQYKRCKYFIRIRVRCRYALFSVLKFIILISFSLYISCTQKWNHERNWNVPVLALRYSLFLATTNINI